MGELFGGRYELVDVLATGGSSTVWRAWDHRDSRLLAAKVLRQSDSDSLLRFMRESTQKMTHEHVLAPLSWTGEDQRILFTMPLVRGGSVDDLLRDFGALPTGWAAELARQVLVALAHVHDAGVVHRDVKPANLLLEATGTGHPHLYLSDFGASWHRDSPRLTQVDHVIGTPGYLAPELATGSDPSPAQDLYAVGVLLTQMLSGVPPAREGGFSFIPATSGSEQRRRLQELADRLADPVPSRRPESAREALDLLDRILGSGSLHVDEDPDNPVEVMTHVPALPEEWREGAGTGSDVPMVGDETPTQVLRRPEATVQPQGPVYDPAPQPSGTASERLPTRPGAGRWQRFAPVFLIVVGVVLIVLAFVLG